MLKRVTGIVLFDYNFYNVDIRKEIKKLVEIIFYCGIIKLIKEIKGES